MIGNYRQLRHGSPHGPDLEHEIANAPEDLPREAVAAYLRGCYVLAATTARTRDVLDAESDQPLPMDLHTDGRYVWYEDLAHYVERYGVAVPADLVERAVRGDLPVMDADAQRAAMAWVRSAAAASRGPGS